MALRIARRIFVAGCFCFLATRHVIAADVVVRSPEFCFEAWFPEPPLEQDENRVTKQKIAIRGRRFLDASEKDALLLTVVKFDSALVTDRNLDDYFGSVVAGYAKKVRGTVERSGESKYQGLPSKTFSLAWTDHDQRWRSENLIVYDHGYTFTMTAVFAGDAKMSRDARQFVQRLRVDRRCTSKSH